MHDTLIVFLGWATVINVMLLGLSFGSLTLGHRLVLRAHTALFGLDAETLMPMYLTVLGQYKILIIVFCLVPWIVLRFLM
jgi:hypothetical protein